MSKPEFPPGDYVSPNLERVRPDDAFPNMVIGDTSTSTWPHLRREISHNWYVDRRAPTVGFVSRDEASIVYNTARVFDGKPCLEIGCWRGWSTVHMALGAHSLDSIDPILGDPAAHGELVETLRQAGVEDRVQLHASRSPEGVEELAARTGKRWSFAFIDGDHEGNAPLVDAEVVQRFAAEDALIILHDVAAPEPAAALTYLRDQGWTTAIYQTMQILGVATRGKCRAVRHIPDPSQKWSLPKHLTSFAIVGESHRSAVRRIAVAMGRPAAGIPESSSPADTEELERAATGDALRAAEEVANELMIAREGRRLDIERSFDDLHTRSLKLAETLAEQKVTQSRLEADLADAHSARNEALAEGERLRAQQTRLLQATEQMSNERLAIEGSFDDLHASSLKLVGTLSEQKVTQARLETDLAGSYSSRDQALAESDRLRAEQARLVSAFDQLTNDRLAVERSFDDLHRRYLKLAETLSDQKLTQSRLEADLASSQRARDEALAERDRLRAEQIRLEGLLHHSTRALAARSDREAPRQLENAELAQLRDRTERLSRKLRKAQANDKWFRSRYLTMQAVNPFTRGICRPRVLLGLARRSALGKEAETRQILAATFSAQGDGQSLPPRALAWLSRPRTLFGLLRRRVLTGRASAEGVLASALRAHLGDGDAIPRDLSRPDSEHALAQVQRSLDKVTAQLTAEQQRAGEEHRRAEEIARKLTAVEQAMLTEERALYDAQVELTKLRRNAAVDSAPTASEGPLEVPR